MTEVIAKISSLTAHKKRYHFGQLEESAGHLKKLSQKTNPLDFKDYATSQIIVNSAEIIDWQKQHTNRREKHLLVVNRGLLDMIPLACANFLFGRLDASGFASILNNIHNNLKIYRDFHNVVLLLLVTSEESLQRNFESGEAGYGQVTNPKFLPLLLEQYIRFHQQLLSLFWSGDTLQGLDQPLDYACLDMSGRDITLPTKLYSTALGVALLHHASPQKKSGDLYLNQLT